MVGCWSGTKKEERKKFWDYYKQIMQTEHYRNKNNHICVYLLHNEGSSECRGTTRDATTGKVKFYVEELDFRQGPVRCASVNSVSTPLLLRLMLISCT